MHAILKNAVCSTTIMTLFLFIDVWQPATAGTADTNEDRRRAAVLSLSPEIKANFSGLKLNGHGRTTCFLQHATCCPRYELCCFGDHLCCGVRSRRYVSIRGRTELAPQRYFSPDLKLESHARESGADANRTQSSARQFVITSTRKLQTCENRVSRCS